MSDTITSTVAQNDSYRQVKGRGIAGFLWLLVALQYAALCYAIVLVPLTIKIASGTSIDKAWDWMGAGTFGLFCLMVMFGAQRMNSALKMPNKLIAKRWTAGAAVLALPAAYSYLLLMDKVLLIWSGNYFNRLSGFIFIPMVYALVIFSFYVPFIFLTCWLNYRYGGDEF